MNREQLQAKIAKELRNQDYGAVNAQPSTRGMAWAITNVVWDDIVAEVLVYADIRAHAERAEAENFMINGTEILRMLDGGDRP